MEGLAAFFLESTFLGLWLFGWNVLPRGIHLVTAWLVAVGACLSAAFIIAANSWMQNPRGYTINPDNGRAQLTSIADVFTNPIFLWGYAHVLAVALIFGGAVLLAVSAWHMRRGQHVELFRSSAKLGLFVLTIATVVQFPIGGRLGINETDYQPMKIAAAEANWTTCQPCSFSVIQIGGYNQDETPTKIIEIPHLLSILATGTWDGEVQGLSEVNAEYNQQYGPGYYVPNVFVQYWSMRVMAYLGSLVALMALWGVWRVWRKKKPLTTKWFARVMIWAAVLPFLMNTAGWMLTENGRQPWIVQGLQQTKDAVSPSVTTATVAISLGTFVLLFVALGIIDFVLMVRYGRKELAPAPELDEEGVPVPVMTY
jgi:cytochrome d ubiquinol oxidase subunit I